MISPPRTPGRRSPPTPRRAAPTASFVDWAKSSAAATYAFRGFLFGPGSRRRRPEAPRARSSRRQPGASRDLVNMGALTIISNIYGNPAVSIPAGTVDGLPVGMQVLARHHADELLFDVALAVERDRPWPLVAPERARSSVRG